MSVKIIDLNEEVKELPDAQRASAGQQGCPPAIEEEPKEVANEVVEERNEDAKEEVKEEVKAKPKPKPKPKASDIVPCPDCNKNMTYKNLRYSHKCSPEPPPVKKQAKPQAKQQPKPKPAPQVYYSDSEEEEHKPLSKPVKNQILKPQPTNPVNALYQHYQLLQQQMMQQKQERYNKICSNMFAPRAKKR